MMSTSMDSGSEMSKTPRTGAYEYLFLARSGAKSHSDLDECQGEADLTKNRKRNVS